MAQIGKIGGTRKKRMSPAAVAQRSAAGRRSAAARQARRAAETPLAQSHPNPKKGLH